MRLTTPHLHHKAVTYALTAALAFGLGAATYAPVHDAAFASEPTQSMDCALTRPVKIDEPARTWDLGSMTGPKGTCTPTSRSLPSAMARHHMLFDVLTDPASPVVGDAVSFTSLGKPLDTGRYVVTVTGTDATCEVSQATMVIKSCGPARPVTPGVAQATVRKTGQGLAVVAGRTSATGEDKS